MAKPPRTIGGRRILFDLRNPKRLLFASHERIAEALRDGEPPDRKLSGRERVWAAYTRRPDELRVMRITRASRALATETGLKPRYIEELLRELGIFQKANRGQRRRKQR